MRIVKPYDWEFVPSTVLDVVVEGVDQSGLQCILWPKDAFFAAPLHARPVLARTRLLPCGQGIAIARLSALQAWQSCVIGILTQGGETELAISGVNLARSAHTDWLSTTSGLRPEDVAQQVRYPLSTVSIEASHHGTADRLPQSAVPDVAALATIPGEGAPIRIVRLAHSEICDASGVLLRDCCVGLGDTTSAALMADPIFVSSAVYMARLQDVYTYVPAGLVLLAGRAIWSDSSIAAFFNDPDLRQYPRLFRAAGEVGMVIDGIRHASDILDHNLIDRMPGMPLLVCNIGYRNHAHWLLNTLLAVFWAQEDIRSGRICLLVPEHSQYVFETLASLDIPRRSILVAPPGLYHLEEILFPSTLSTHANHYPPPAAAAMFEQIRRHCLSQDVAAGPELIYVTRIGSATQRKITNELDLVAALRHRGFACVAPHELSFTEEVACFARARVIVGQLGAGLANIGFAPPGCTVVEITSHNYTSNDYWFLSQALGHRFVRIMVRAETTDELTLADFSFAVPIAETLAAIDKVLERFQPDCTRPPVLKPL